MRWKHKKPLAIVLTALVSLNILAIIYDQYVNITPEDILRNPAVIDQLGPPLPPDDLEEQLTQHGRDPPPTTAGYIISNALNGTTPKNDTPGLRAVTDADKFLLHSYLRSGASQVAEALNLNHREIFYLHHPLERLDEKSPTSGISFLHHHESKKGVEWLKGIFNCSFQGNEKLISDIAVWKSHSLRRTYKRDCKHLTTTDCLETACRQRSLHAIFTIRLSLSYIYQLVKFYEGTLKVIVILRDPRVILANRRRDNIGHPLKSVDDFQKEASKLCRVMENDVRRAKLINKNFPNSVLVLRHEHLMIYPASALTYLYEFLGLEVSSTRFLEVSEVMKLLIPEEQRSQLTKSWQLDLTLQESRAVDNGCEHSYETLGYFPVPKKITTYNQYFITWDQAMSNIKT